MKVKPEDQEKELGKVSRSQSKRSRIPIFTTEKENRENRGKKEFKINNSGKFLGTQGQEFPDQKSHWALSKMDGNESTQRSFS